MNYVLHILILINIYIVLALSLNVLVGYIGLISLCHAAFYGIGAYISALCMMKLGLGFPLATLAAVAGTVLLSFVISIPSLRLKNDYFILASLGFQIITFSVLYNWVDVTGGPYGITEIPRPDIFGIEINSTAIFFLLSCIITLVCSLLIYLIGHSPFGRALKAIREDELAASALGKNVPRFKVITFAIAAGFAAVAGSVYAGYMRFIDPSSFTIMESVFIMSIIIIGGTGNIKGPVAGVVLMMILPEALRFIGIPDTIAFNLRQIIYGIMIILIMRYKPQGLWGEYRF